MMKPELIFAMDGEWTRAVNVAILLYNELGVRWVKIGPQNIDKLLGLLHMRQNFPLRDLKIFLDLKLADTEDTCEKAVDRYRELGIAAVSTFTHDATVGAIRGAWNGERNDVLVWRAIRLTDEDQPIDIWQRLKVWGDGVICPGGELTNYAVRSAPMAHRVVPGVRRARKDDVHNHLSPTTPAQAVACGATHLVVGRPIYEAADPVAEARDILREMMGVDLKMRDTEHVTFDGEVRYTTDDGILFYIEDLEEEVWFPASQCELSGDKSSIMVPRWLAEKKGLI